MEGKALKSDGVQLEFLRLLVDESFTEATPRNSKPSKCSFTGGC